MRSLETLPFCNASIFNEEEARLAELMPQHSVLAPVLGAAEVARGELGVRVLVRGLQVSHHRLELGAAVAVGVEEVPELLHRLF